MFGALKKVISNVNKLNSGVLLKKVLDGNTQLQYDIIQLNTQKQLYEQGVFADGMPTGTYTKSTIYGTSKFEGKIAKGQPYDHVTFKDTGAMYESERIKITNDGFIMSMNTIKGGEDLNERYGHEIEGLTQESKAQVGEWVLPSFRDETLKAILKR